MCWKPGIVNFRTSWNSPRSFCCLAGDGNRFSSPPSYTETKMSAGGPPRNSCAAMPDGNSPERWRCLSVTSLPPVPMYGDSTDNRITTVFGRAQMMAALPNTQ